MRIVNLSSGSKGNSTYVETSKNKILLDAGRSIDYLRESLESIGVSLEDIDIINKYKEEFLEIKASGGIRDIEMVNNLLEKGVTRLGMSNIDCLKGSKE